MGIKVQTAGKRFDRRWIFRDLTFEVEEGEVIALCGKNGSGKSTLLKAIAGLLPLSEGTIDYPEPDLRWLLGYSGIDASLYGDLSVLEQLNLAANLRGYSCDALQLLEFVNLDYAKDKLVRELSTGMRSRLRLAIAIQIHPRYLLLDEPGAALDIAGIEILHQVISLQQKVGAVIIATNDSAERSQASRIINLDGIA